MILAHCNFARARRLLFRKHTQEQRFARGVLSCHIECQPGRRAEKRKPKSPV